MDDKYNVIDWIRSGDYGTVFKALDLITSDTVAIQMVPLEDESLGLRRSIIQEVSLLKDMEHENVVRLLDVLNTENHGYLVFEYLDCRLSIFMDQSPPTAEGLQLVKHFLLQILRGVAYCHSHRIIHRNLNPENLLIDTGSNILKLANFGNSRAVDAPLEIYTNMVGTLHYMAPEMLFGLGKYSAPVDIWAVGCIFGEMVRHEPMFCGIGTSHIHQVDQIFSVMGSPNEENWPELMSQYPFIEILRQWPPKDLSKEVPGLEPAGLDLLSKLLCLDPSRRITARDALNHAYFRDV